MQKTHSSKGYKEAVSIKDKLGLKTVLKNMFSFTDHFSNLESKDLLYFNGLCLININVIVN